MEASYASTSATADLRINKRKAYIDYKDTSQPMLSTRNIFPQRMKVMVTEKRYFYSCHDLNRVLEKQPLHKGIITTVNLLHKHFVKNTCDTPLESK